MGDRFFLDRLFCAYCGNIYSPDEQIYYAPTCGFFDFECSKCCKTNYITWGCNSCKIEDIPDEEEQWLLQQWKGHPVTEELEKLGKVHNGKETSCPHSNIDILQEMIKAIGDKC